MKTRERFYFLTSALLSLICVSLLVILSVKKFDPEIREALDSCIQEIASECRGLHGYSVVLETENSRLNKELVRCKNENR